MTPYGWKQFQVWTSIHNEAGTVLVNVLAVMVTLLLLFLAAFTFVANRFSLHIKEQNKLIAKNLSEAGLSRWLHQLSNNQTRFDSLTFDSPNGGEVKASLSAWGPFGLVVSTGQFANQKITSNSVIGSRPNKYFDAAITVGDESLPLVASGNTEIVGDINLGDLGLTTGRMRGEAIVNENFHKGEVSIHKAIDLPKLDTTFILKYLFDVKERKLACKRVLSGSVVLTYKDSTILTNFESIIVENNLRLQDVILEDDKGIRSIFVNGFVEITGRSKLLGLIEIISSGPIYFKDSSFADKVILMTSDSIIMTDNSVFSAIAISGNKIVLNDKARLVYPSLLLIQDIEQSTEDETGIFLNSRNSLESVCYAERNVSTTDRSHPLVYLDSLCSFTGIIISENQVDLRGKMLGSVFTERFHYFFSPTTYVNWIKDFHIDRSKLTYLPILPMLTNASDSIVPSVLRTDFLP